MMSDVMDGPSPSFSAELSPVMIASDSEELFESSPPSAQLSALMPVNIPTSSTSSASSEIQDHAAVAASVATSRIAPAASSALAALAMVANAVARGSNASSNRGGIPSMGAVIHSSSQDAMPSAGQGGSASMCGTVPPTLRGSSPSSGKVASTSSSLYYGETPTCVVCTDEMIAPGVTDRACDHRSTCSPCLRQILSGGRGRGWCVLCREPYSRVF